MKHNKALISMLIAVLVIAVCVCVGGVLDL